MRKPRQGQPRQNRVVRVVLHEKHREDAESHIEAAKRAAGRQFDPGSAEPLHVSGLTEGRLLVVISD